MYYGNVPTCLIKWNNYPSVSRHVILTSEDITKVLRVRIHVISAPNMTTRIIADQHICPLPISDRIGQEWSGSFCSIACDHSLYPVRRSYLLLSINFYHLILWYPLSLICPLYHEFSFLVQPVQMYLVVYVSSWPLTCHHASVPHIFSFTSSFRMDSSIGELGSWLWSQPRYILLRWYFIFLDGRIWLV